MNDTLTRRSVLGNSILALGASLFAVPAVAAYKEEDLKQAEKGKLVGKKTIVIPLTEARILGSPLAPFTSSFIQFSDGEALKNLTIGEAKIDGELVYINCIVSFHKHMSHPWCSPGIYLTFPLISGKPITTESILTQEIEL